MKTGRVLSWESHLIDRASQGDQVAFDIITDQYRPTLTALAMRMLRNSDDASDAVQETLVKAFRAIHDFDPERPLKPWLCRICANCCVDSVRLRKRDGESLDQHENFLSNADDVDAQAEMEIQQGQVIEAIDRLPARYREIIILRHFKHMDVTEIATELDKPEGTVKSWLFRARAQLKKDLQPAMG